MAFPPKVSPDSLDSAFRAVLGECVCNHLASEHAAGSGECMALQRHLGGQLVIACDCRGFQASRPPLPAMSRGWLARALGALSFASELARAAWGHVGSEIAAWRAARRAHGRWETRLCTRPAPHRCCVDGPCNGYPRP